MRVLKSTVEITDISGKKHICYTLSKYSRNYPTGAKRTYAYFDVDTFDYFDVDIFDEVIR
jgi:hypothetical protein